MSDREHGTATWMRHVEAAIDAEPGPEPAPPVGGEEEVARTIDTIMHRPPPPGLATTSADEPPRRDSIRYKKRMKRAARAAAVDAQALGTQPMAPAIDQAAVSRDALAQSTRYSVNKCRRQLDGTFATMGKLRAFHASCVQEVERRCRDTKRKRDAVEDEDEDEQSSRTHQQSNV